MEQLDQLIDGMSVTLSEEDVASLEEPVRPAQSDRDCVGSAFRRTVHYSRSKRRTNPTISFATCSGLRFVISIVERSHRDVRQQRQRRPPLDEGRRVCQLAMMPAFGCDATDILVKRTLQRDGRRRNATIQRELFHRGPRLSLAVAFKRRAFVITITWCDGSARTRL